MIDLSLAGDVLGAARQYLEMGWSVIPLAPNGVRPVVKWEEYQERRATLEELDQWVTRWPGMNLGLVTGLISGVTVVDIDGSVGVESAQRLPTKLPETLTQKTPRGYNLVYRYAEGVRNTADTTQGIDIRGEGGYIVVAPSRREKTPQKPGGVYSWRRQVDPVDFPVWITEVLGRHDPPQTAGEAVAAAPGWVSHHLENGAEAGERNQTAARLAGYFFGLGLPQDVVLTILEPYAGQCKPPMDRAELAKVVLSTGRYQKRALQAGIVAPPTRVETLVGEKFTFDEDGITIELGQMRPARDSYYAELVVGCDLPGLPPRLHGPVSLNVMDTGAREKEARYLKGRLDVNWPDYLEIACRLAIESYRQGDPVILLREAHKPSAGTYLVRPLLLSGGPTMWFAQGGTFKSYFALAVACTLDGHDVIPGLRAERPVRVAFLDWEWDAWIHNERMRALLGAEAEDCSILYRRCYGPLEGMVESLRRMVDDEGIEFVVVDSVGMACKGEPESAISSIGFQRALRALGVGSLLISHVTKNGDTQYPFGSMYWHNTCRATWYIAKNDETGELGFYNRKANQGKLWQAQGFRVAFTEDTVRISSAELTAPDLEIGRA